MPTILKEKLFFVKKLYYEDKKSMREIAERLSVSLDAVTYFMRLFGLKRRTFSEEMALRFERKPPSFKAKNRLSKEDEILKAVGVSLYWGEGYKAHGARGVDFANSDACMILTFLRFLREICGVDEKRITIYTYCYLNQDVKKVIGYWSKVTKISKDKFSKPYVRKDFRLEKISKMPYGLIHIRYSDKKLLLLIMSWIEEYKNKCAGTQVVNEGSL